jgi:hypothetical protein
LLPGLKLNLVLIVALAIVHVMLPSDWREARPALYMLLAGGVSGLAYLAAFLFLPAPALADEALRWRRVLKLSA